MPRTCLTLSLVFGLVASAQAWSPQSSNARARAASSQFRSQSSFIQSAPRHVATTAGIAKKSGPAARSLASKKISPVNRRGTAMKVNKSEGGGMVKSPVKRKWGAC
jgi:hypothetical protein